MSIYSLAVVLYPGDLQKERKRDNSLLIISLSNKDREEQVRIITLYFH